MPAYCTPSEPLARRDIARVPTPGHAPDAETPGDRHCLRTSVLQAISQRAFGKKRSLLMEAQAGQGKTTFARQYLDHVTTRGLWCCLEPGDTDAAHLIARLYSLLKSSIKPFASRLVATRLARGDISYQGMGKIAKALRADLKKALKTDLFIVFDDLHHIENSPAALKFLTGFLSQSNQGLYFILISRRRIPRQVRALFQSGQCVYLDSRALAFSREETREFVHRCLEIPLSREQLHRLHRDTCGWIMGIKSRCLGMTSARSVPLDGNATLDVCYFDEEVYPAMAAHVSNALLKLALLEEIPLPLARQAEDEKSLCETLAYLCRNHFFLSRGEANDDTYAFHPLFRDFLGTKCREQCPPHEIAQFLDMAGKWYEKSHAFLNALSCYVQTQNADAVEALLERQGVSIYRTEEPHAVYDLLRRIPGCESETRGWTLYFSGLLALEADPASALGFLHLSRTLFVTGENLSGEFLATTEICISHILMDAHISVAIPLFDRATELFNRLRPSLSPFCLTRAATALGTCHLFFSGDTNASEACASLAKATAREHGMQTLLVEAYTASCFNRMGRGRFFKSAEELDAQFVHLSHPGTKASARLRAGLAQLNQLEITGDFFNYNHLKPILHRQTRHDLLRHTVFQGISPLWETCQALATGDPDQALQLIDNALASDKASHNAHLQSQLRHYQAYIYGLKNEPEKALQAASVSLALRDQATVPYFVTLQAMVLGAMYVQLDRPEEAEAFLGRAIEKSRGSGERFIRCGALAHRALLNLKRQRTTEAFEDTRNLLSLMEKERYVHFDTWTPRVMLPVLQFAHARGIMPDVALALAEHRLNISFDAQSRILPLLEITTLGRFGLYVEGHELLDGTRLSHNEQRLLAAIICSPSRSIGIHAMFHMIWPDSDEEKALKALKVMLFRLRKKISHPARHPDFDFQDYLQHKNRQLFLAHCRIDAHDFLDAASRGTAQCRNHQHWQACNSFRYALSLWKGPFLQSIAYDDAAGEFNDRFFLNTLSNAATSWSALIATHGDPSREDLELIERSVSRGAGTADMLKNLFDLHTAAGNTGKIRDLTLAYRDALIRTGYTEEEVNEELDRLWDHENGMSTD
ncbi:BTAD domain-containing putative transcriptional regulator [Desulfoluna spongiiphila]|uniref:BTAD domain-containing putative transcriptional regulator n=1 Tax=Desulfoluna spongiiphila TaxID=419481 RepID=UPI0012569E43|nr:BTAD domain-containing putative transcriptional regulator [Desulfoluna spongiiphila]VVS92375.1 signal transduction response regulator c-terminal effector [Desulfoluna spongiiphila]